MSGAPSLDLRPFQGGEGPVGILLLHGFTAAVPEVRPLAERLAREKQFQVRAPLLPGHGTHWRELNSLGWKDLADHAQGELNLLHERCEQVFVGGLSMGGLLALHLAQENARIAGVIPMAAALYASDPLRFLVPIVSRLVDSTPKNMHYSQRIVDPKSAHLLWSYERTPLGFVSELFELMRKVRDNMQRVTQPLLIFHGDKDRTVPLRAAEYIAGHCASDDVRLIRLKNSGHCLSVDGERDLVGEECVRWIANHSNPEHAQET